ncbi:MAG: AEC family transporter [Bacteroidota bacterium]|nr:AEC family transporter [Bacteroidota bacterium]
MSEVFTDSFISMLNALSQIFIVILGAGILVRRRIVSQNDIRVLSKITVIILLPSFIFANTLESFNPDKLPLWWLLPLLGMLMSLIGVLFAAGVFAFDYSKHRNLIAVASMQNAGYLVFPIGKILYPEQFNEFALITFLFILGYNPLLWTLGKYYITASDRPQKIEYKSLITPPAVANILALLLVLAGIQAYIPKELIKPVELVGDAAIPVATFVLGATLGAVSWSRFPKWFDCLRVILVKYVLLPVITIALLRYFNLGQTRPLLSDFLVIQSAAAPATGLILMVRTYGGQTQKVASAMIISYLVCLFAMPFWIALWHYIQ